MRSRRGSSVHLLPRTRGRSFRKPAKCSRIRLATSFAVWCLVLASFIAKVIRTVSRAGSASLDKGVSVGSVEAGSSGEVGSAVLACGCGNSSSAIRDAPTKWHVKETCPMVLPLSDSRRLPVFWAAVRAFFAQQIKCFAVFDVANFLVITSFTENRDTFWHFGLP